MEERIAVLGAGGIGGSIAAYLARDGRDVTVIDQWPSHVDAIRKNGLTLTNRDDEFNTPVEALHLSEASGLKDPFDMVFLSVKSYDTIWSTYFIEPHLKPSGFILPAQNALNDETVARIVGFNRTVGCVVTIGAAVYEPSHVIRTDAPASHCFTVGELSGLVTPRVQSVVEALNCIGPSSATTNIWGARWSKMIANCMGNALAGLIGPAASSMAPDEAQLASLIRVVTGCEVVRVGEALGVSVEPLAGVPASDFASATALEDIKDIRDRLQARFSSINPTPEQIERLGAPARPSLLQDVIKGRKTEVDHLNGHIVAEGEKVEVPTPMNAAIVEVMNLVERGELQPHPSNMERLESYVVR
jgi:2-dehydropantoate 2-reductase